MKHLFLNRELSQLAKDKGFDEPCLACYYKDGTFAYHPDSDVEVDAPLYQQIIDWFREKHNFYIDVYPNDRKLIPNKKWWDFQITNVGDYKSPELAGSEEGIDYYYEALDKAIEEAFKLI